MLIADKTEKWHRHLGVYGKCARNGRLLVGGTGVKRKYADRRHWQRIGRKSGKMTFVVATKSCSRPSGI